MEAQWKPKKHVDDVDQDDGVRLGRHGRREDARVCQGDARAHGVSALCEDGRSSVALPSASRRRWVRTRCPGRRDYKTAHTGGDASSSVILGIARSQGCSGSSGARAQFPTALPKFMASYLRGEAVVLTGSRVGQATRKSWRVARVRNVVPQLQSAESPASRCDRPLLERG